MKKNLYKEAPANFSVCAHTDCTCGSTCLRQLESSSSSVEIEKCIVQYATSC